MAGLEAAAAIADDGAALRQPCGWSEIAATHSTIKILRRVRHGFPTSAQRSHGAAPGGR